MRLQTLLMMFGVVSWSAGLLSGQMGIASAGSISAQAQEIAQTNSLVGRVGQLDAAKPVKMTVTNKTSIPLYAAISGGASIDLAPQAGTTFTFNATPINVFVYPVTGEASLKFNTSVQGNVVTVEVTQINSDTPGDGAINIRHSGIVYVY